MYWTEIYPHEIWTNMLVIDNKLIDYKIGDSKRNKYSWTIPFDDELIKRFSEVEVISSYEVVYNDTEHEQAFENGRNKVTEYTNKFGFYK